MSPHRTALAVRASAHDVHPAAIIAAAVIVSLGGLGAMALYLRRPKPVATGGRPHHAPFARPTFSVTFPLSLD